MQIDLRERIAQVLSPDMGRQLAATVGMDEGTAASFVDAAIPTLLAAFLGAFETEGGAKALSDAVSNSDPYAIEHLRRALAARDMLPLSEGVNALTPVLGVAMRDTLASGLAGWIDAPVEVTTRALGAVTQAAIAAIGQQDPALWSDADAVRNFLSSQRAAILAAAPPSLAALVAPAPPPVVEAQPPPKLAPERPPPQAARAPCTPLPPPPPPVAGFPLWLVAAIIVVILAIAGYVYWSKRSPKPDAGFVAPPTTYAAVRLNSGRG